MNTHRSLKSKVFDHAVIAAMLLTPFAAASAQNLTSAPNFVPFSEFVQVFTARRLARSWLNRGRRWRIRARRTDAAAPAQPV